MRHAQGKVEDLTRARPGGYFGTSGGMISLCFGSYQKNDILTQPLTGEGMRKMPWLTASLAHMHKQVNLMDRANPNSASTQDKDQSNRKCQARDVS